MKDLISDMNIMINVRIKAFFAVNLKTTIGDAKIYSWKLLKGGNGEYYIEPPFEKHKDSKTGEIKYSKNFHIKSSSMSKMITDSAVIEYKKKHRELVNQIASNKEVQNANTP